MTEKRWLLAHTIFEAAAARAGPERQQYVEANAPDAEIAGKVLAMLEEMETVAKGDDFPETDYSIGRVADPVSELTSGTALGRFVITGLVGQGGMGKVYSAHDPDLNREVALKVIARREDDSSSERWIREAQAASALNHPNIVTVYEVIRAGTALAIAMELVTGTSLGAFCGTAQPVEKLADWAQQIANALAAAHARGIVHRDIKPDNLMLRSDGYIKVLDFGLARQAGTDRAVDELAAGTLGYMSPEEVLQRPITAASDIFSLGVVLYELASGTNPFRGDSPGATTRLITGLVAPSLPVQGKGLPRELDRLVRAMLSKSPENRPSASEVARNLAAIDQPRRLRRRAAWGAAALVGCALVGTAAWRMLPSERATSKPSLLRSVPLDSEPASETDPAFSPDGGSVVYASDLGSSGVHHIMIRSVAGVASGEAASNRPVLLTTGPLDDKNPVWSPDGSRIAFLRRLNTEVLQAIVIPARGGLEQVITNVPGHHFQPNARKYVTWAPDGEALVAAQRVDGAFGLRLRRFPLSGGTSQPVTEGPDTAMDVSPKFSPDGRWLAYLRWENGGTFGLWIVAQPGTKPRLLVNSPAPIATFAWRPDSRTIVYGVGAMGTGELWQVTVGGDRSIAPFVLEGAPDEIAIAQNGGRLSYVLENLDSNIWRVPLGETSRKNLPSPQKLFASVREESDPAISPDGRSIAFISNRSGNWNLWIGNEDGSGLRESEAGSLLPFHPAWSPDSRTIAFDSKASGSSQIWLVTAAGGPATRLVAMPGGAEVPSWSRDGKSIFFYTNAKGTRQIWEVPAGGGSPVQLTRGAGSFDPLESPDGRYLYHGNMLSPGVWRSPLQPRLPDGSMANPDQELIRETQSMAGHRFWTLGQGGIYFVDALSRPVVLKFVDLASRQVRVLATMSKPPAKFTRSLSVSSDGRYALYCQDDADRYEIRLVEDFR